MSLITLGVKDLERSRRFYAKLGFTEAAASDGDVVFYNMGGCALGLFPLDTLLKFEGIGTPPSPGAITLAYNTRTREETDTVMRLFLDAGGTLLSAAHEYPWGSYSGYVGDPDGHPWEISYLPSNPVQEDGSVRF